MSVGNMRVSVRQRCMSMVVRVRFVESRSGIMLVLVVCIVEWAVLVLHLLVCVPVRVMLAKQKDDARRHDQRRAHLGHLPPLAEQEDGGDRSSERRRGEECR